MRRTYRDGTRTLFPARTVWPLCRTFFVPEPLRQKKALLRVLLPVQHSQGTRPRPPCLKGENARFSELSCRPCPNSFPQGPTFPQFSRPSRPAACSCPLRCAQGHHSEATQGITAKQALVQGVRTVPMPHQTSSLPVAFALPILSPRKESGADESHCASRSCRLYVVLTLGSTTGSTTGSTIRRPRPRSGAPQPPLSAAALPKGRKEWPAALHLRFVPACPFHRRSHGGLPVCFLFRCSGQCPGTVQRQTGPGHGQPCSSFWSLHADSSFCLCRPGRAPESFPEDLRALPSGRLRLEAFPPGSLRSFRYFRKPFSRMRAKSSAGMGLA